MSNDDRAETNTLEAANENDAIEHATEQLDTFYTEAKNLRHMVEHVEYGIVFSKCGLRIKKQLVDYNAPPVEDEVMCQKCQWAYKRQMAQHKRPPPSVKGDG